MPTMINIIFVTLFSLFLDVRKLTINSIKSRRDHIAIQPIFRTRSTGIDIPSLPPID